MGRGLAGKAGGRTIRYRRFGRLGDEVSVLGLGIRHFKAGENLETAGGSRTLTLLKRAIREGVNYLCFDLPPDLAECRPRYETLRQALDGVRQKIKIAAGLPSSFLEFKFPLERYLEEVLDLLACQYLDFLIFTDFNRDTWPPVHSLGLIPRAEKLMVSQRVRWLGFGFRDDFQTLKKVLEGYDNWALAHFDFSFMDAGRNPGTAGLRLAASRGLAVVATDPFKSGRLLQKIPLAVQKVWEEASPRRPPAEWCLRWLWSNPDIATVVIDIGLVKELEAGLALARNIEMGPLSIREQLVINQVRDAYLNLKPVPCTGCRSCLPCPAGINIPRIFELYNEAIIYQDTAMAKRLYRREGHRADLCNECGRCLITCGRHIVIPDRLKTAGTFFDQQADS